MKPLVSVIIVARNSASFIKKCVDAVLAQDYPRIEMIYVDNASTDQTLEEVDETRVKVIRNSKNEGFARANNQAVEKSRGDYVLFLNSDAIIERSFISKVIDATEACPSAGSACGKILRTPEAETVPVLDSAGFKIEHWRLLPLDRGDGQIDGNDFNQLRFVFGAPGAVCLYRRKTLEQIKIDGEYFDTDFFIYYEDVDLAWRARLAGWQCLYVPEAVAYHKKRGPDGKEDFIQAKALTNRYWCYLKNDFFLRFLAYAPLAVPYEIIRVMRYLLRKPALTGYYFRELKMAACMFAKRKKIRKKIFKSGGSQAN